MDSEQPDPKMSNSDPDCLLPEDDKIKFEISKTPMLENHAKKEEGPSSKECETSPSSSMTEELGNKVSNDVVVVDEQNDGFKTPTALDHKIPVITECPAAPRKSRIPLRKRKALNSPSASRKRIQINVSEEEFQALFSPPHDFRGKIKKASPDGAI